MLSRLILPPGLLDFPVLSVSARFAFLPSPTCSAEDDESSLLPFYKLFFFFRLPVSLMRECGPGPYDIVVVVVAVMVVVVVVDERIAR